MQKLTTQTLCELAGSKWTGNVCSSQEGFIERLEGDFDIDTDEKLYDINKYYTPKETFDNKAFDMGEGMSNSILPLCHLFKCIDLKKLENFTPAMNKGFVKFINILNRVLRGFPIKQIPELINIMGAVNAVLYYNKIEEEKYTKFWFLVGLYTQASMDKFGMIGSLSLTKCLPSDNLILYYYNIPADELINTDCNSIVDTTDFATVMKNTKNKNTPTVTATSTPTSTSTTTKYKISIVDLGMISLKTLDPSNITEYNRISDAYLKIIQFYINNSTKLDTFTTISQDKELLIKILDLVVIYIEAIEYVLPNMPEQFRYSPSDLQKIKDKIIALRL